MITQQKAPNKKNLHMTNHIAVLLPCLNEEATIGKTIAGFRTTLPEATIYVFDNDSVDKTVGIATAAGAIVFRVPQRGKGCVISRMFAEIEADIYVLADGDNQYDPATAPTMVERLCQEHLDMVVGARDCRKEIYRPGHFWGNRFFNKVVTLLFGRCFTDIFSGYRVLSRRLVKSFPAFSTGFEIEAELSIHALELRLPVAEVKTPYKRRPENSSSKLKTVRHGLMIFLNIIILFTKVKSFVCFSLIATTMFVFGLISGYPVIAIFVETGEVPYLPRAILAASFMILASLSLVCGLILHSVNQTRREIRRMHYLQTRR